MGKRSRGRVIACGALLLLSRIAIGREWQLVSPVPSAADLTAVAWAAPGYVAVGKAGTILTSDDGVSWRAVPSPTTSDLAAVTWSGAAFVAVGAGGVVLTSHDGASWSLRDSGTTAGIEGICAGPAGLLVAVGEGGTVLTSTDGRTWRAQESGATATLRGVTWAGGAFVAVGDAVEGLGTVVMSADAVHWGPARGDAWGDLWSVAWNGSVLVIGTAPGCDAWTERAVGRFVEGELVVEPLESGTGFARGLTWCGGRFVAVGWWGGHSTSTDGQAWGLDASPAEMLALEGVTCGPDGPHAVGRGGQIAVSPDGDHWQLENGWTELDLDVASDGTRAVAIAMTDAFRPLALASADGVLWQPATELEFDAYGGQVRFGNGRFVIAGTRQVARGDVVTALTGVATSTDGVVWQYQWFREGVLTALAWDGSRFVAAGSAYRGGFVATSPDGVAWELSDTAAVDYLRRVASDGSTLVAVSAEGGALRNGDGWSWEAVELPTADRAWDVGFVAGRFVVVGERGSLATSADGATWEAIWSGTDRDLLGVDVVGDRVVAVGVGGTLLSSCDGLTWELEDTGCTADLLGAATSRCGLTAVGRWGAILGTRCAEGEEPRPAFSWRPPVVVAGAPTELVDQSTGAPAWQHWELGDGTTATGPGVVHAWSAPGSYQVTLRVGTPHGPASTSAWVPVLAPCAAPPVPILAAPPRAGSEEDYAVSWTAEGAEWVEAEESGEQGFAYPTWWSDDQLTGASFSHAWTDGRTYYYRARASRTCFDGVWTSAWSPAVAVRIAPRAQSPGTSAVVVPAAASGAGLNGAHWSTDLILHNVGREVATVALFPLDGITALDKVLEVRLEGDEVRSLADVLSQIPGAGHGPCGLLVGSDRPVDVDARYATGHGAREAVLAVPLEDAVAAAGASFLPGLLREGSLYSNVGATNPTPDPVEVEVELFAGDGSSLGAKVLALQPYGSASATDVLGRLGHDRVREASAVVRRRSGAGRFVAWGAVVDGRSGDAVVRVAGPTAPTWSAASSAITSNTTNVVFGNGVYVAGCWEGVLSSRDGRTWTQCPLGFGVRAVGWNGQQFAAVGWEGAAWSADGSSWHEARLPLARLDDLAWGGGMWLAVGWDKDVAGSRDGEHWEVLEPRPWRLHSVDWAGGGFVVTAGHRLLTTLDGVDWAVWDDFVAATFRDVAWNGSVALAAGTAVVTSTDALRWRLVDRQRGFSRVLWNGNEFVAWEAGFTLSTDGMSWQPLDLPAMPPGGSLSVRSLAWDGRKIVAKVQYADALLWLVEAGPTLVVPGAAHRVDGEGRTWRTDLLLTNTGDEGVTCALDPLGPEGPLAGPVEVTIAAGATSRVDDVLWSLFGLDGEAAVRVAPSAGTVVGAGRTWAAAGSGTVGHGTPALPEAAAIWHFAEGRALGLERSAASTSDLGLVSLCDEAMTVDARVLGDDGRELGELAFDLAPHAAETVPDLLSAVGAGEVGAGTALLTTDSLRCPFLAFVSVRDLATGDRVLLPAVAAPPMPCPP